MAGSPLVSILMGIYNCAGTLQDAVACIKSQTYGNWELILCDDASVDGTMQIAEKLVQEDKRIRLIGNQKNMGLAFTLNRCLELAGGEYVARMDGDDLCGDTRLEKEVKVLQEHPEYAVVSTWMDIFDESGTYGERRYTPAPGVGDLLRHSPFCHAASMMRKDVLLQAGGYRTQPQVLRVEDYDLWTRLYKAGFRGYNIQEFLYSMRDDRNAVKRRKFRYRLNEYRVKKEVCRAFHLPVKDRLLAFRPVIVGLMPDFIYTKLHKKRVQAEKK